jgi:hypothetical protein
LAFCEEAWQLLSCWRWFGCSHGFCANSRWLARGTFSPIVFVVVVVVVAADDFLVVVVDENSIIIVH